MYIGAQGDARTMKIWIGFGSNHSSMYNIVGEAPVVPKDHLPKSLGALKSFVEANGGCIEVKD